MAPGFGSDTLVFRIAPIIRDKVEKIVTAPQQADSVLRRFYENREYRTAWLGSDVADRQRTQALAILRQASDEGLSPSVYRPDWLASSFQSAHDPSELAEIDIRLTEALFRYMRDVRLGSPTRQARAAALDPDVASFDFQEALAKALTADKLVDFLHSLPPQYREYKSLKTALLQYRTRPDADPQRLQQIMLNMERWRWMPRTLGPAFVMVDIVAAKLWVVEDGRTVLTSPVIVGKPATPTPIMRGTASGVTVNPYWNVPLSIARNEILPKLRTDRLYLKSHDIVIRSGAPDDPYGLGIDWKSVSRRDFPFQFRQEPGPGNALGQLKLELDSPFSVYLHDTPERAAFARTNRYLSHGCVRVKEIKQLAAIALSGKPQTDLAMLNTAIDAGDTKTYPLGAPLPVYLLYWTATAQDNGAVEFRRDVYGYDRVLVGELASQPPVNKNTTAVAEVACRE